MAPEPCSAPVVETMTSGRVVPMDTTVAPTTMIEALGDAGGAVHKPVAALDQQHKTNGEQDNRDEHNW